MFYTHHRSSKLTVTLTAVATDVKRPKKIKEREKGAGVMGQSSALASFWVCLHLYIHVHIYMS
jgi:hypothetical protein